MRKKATEGAVASCSTRIRHTVYSEVYTLHTFMFGVWPILTTDSRGLPPSVATGGWPQVYSHVFQSTAIMSGALTNMFLMVRKPTRIQTSSTSCREVKVLTTVTWGSLRVHSNAYGLDKLTANIVKNVPTYKKTMFGLKFPQNDGIL